MRPSVFRALTVPGSLAFVGGGANPSPIVPAAPTFQRVVISHPGGVTFRLADTVEELRSPAAGFFTINGPDSVEVLVLDAGQALYAAQAGGVGGTISVHFADSEIAIRKSRRPGEGHYASTDQFSLGSIAAGNLPQTLAKAPDDSSLRVLVRNVDPAVVLFLATDFNDLTLAQTVHAYRMLPAMSSVFLLAPGQTLFGASLKVGTLPVTVQSNRGALYSDIYLLQ
jgi:hypothetical protein